MRKKINLKYVTAIIILSFQIVNIIPVNATEDSTEEYIEIETDTGDSIDNGLLFGNTANEPDNIDYIEETEFPISQTDALINDEDLFVQFDPDVVYNELGIITEVNTEADLQTALNGDAEIINIIPNDGGDGFLLTKPLTIYKSRVVTLTADSPVRVIGASGQWIMITGVTEAETVSIDFENITLDGNGNSGGIYNRGVLNLTNTVIQNCCHPNGGSGIFSTCSLYLYNCEFINNITNPITLIDGGAILMNAKNYHNVDIYNCLFINNTARYGGAISIYNADNNIVNCSFYGNTATQGSCIYEAGCMDSNILGCEMSGSKGAGIIFANIANIDITDCSITDNTGQAIYCYAVYGDVNLSVGGNSLLSRNSATNSYGAGIAGYSWKESIATVKITDGTVISDNTALNGGGVACLPGSKVYIDITDGAQIINNTAYNNGGGIFTDSILNINESYVSSNTAKNGGGIYGDKNAVIDIESATINENKAEEDGGGIWVYSLGAITSNNTEFLNNLASTGHFWRTDRPADDKQYEDAATHNNNIFNTSFTSPYTNAYSNHDINYATNVILSPYTVSYNGNGNDSGTIPTDKNNPYLAEEVVAVLIPPDTLAKTGYIFTGWDTEPDGTGTFYAYDFKNNLFEPPSFVMDEYNVTLYAQWISEPVQPPDTAEPEDTGLPEETEEQIPAPKPSGIIITYPQYQPPTQYPAETTIIPETVTNTAIQNPLPETPEVQLAAQPPLPDYPPGYELVQVNEDTAILENDNSEIIGEWVEGDDSWTYYTNTESSQLIPVEEDMFEEVENDGTPIGLWTKNEEDEWIYDDLTEGKNPFAILLGLLLLGLIGAGAAFFFIIGRKHVTREEYTRMVVDAISLDTDIKDTVPYTDVTEDDSYYSAVMNAKSAGLLSCFPEPEFKPHTAITREETASIMAKAVQYKNVTIKHEDIDLYALFKDTYKINEVLLPDVKTVVQLKLLYERTGERFNPKGLYYKKQASETVKSLLSVISGNLS